MITIEGIPVNVVARRKERIDEIDAEIEQLVKERDVLLRVIREIDGLDLVEESGSVAAAVSRAVEEGLEHLPENAPPPAAAGQKKWSLRRLLDEVLADGSRRAPADLLFEINKRLKARGRSAVNLPDLEAVVRAGVTSGRISGGTEGYALAEAG